MLWLVERLNNVHFLTHYLSVVVLLHSDWRDERVHGVELRMGGDGVEI